MKYVRSMVVALMLLSTVGFAQSDAPKAPSDSQKAYDKLKTLAGSWQGRVTTLPPQPGMGDGVLTDISLRITSRGNAMVHEMKEAGTADDPDRHDHPVGCSIWTVIDCCSRTIVTQGIGRVCPASCCPTEKRWNSIFSTFLAARSTDT